MEYYLHAMTMIAVSDELTPQEKLELGNVALREAFPDGDHNKPNAKRAVPWEDCFYETVQERGSPNSFPLNPIGVRSI